MPWFKVDIDGHIYISEYRSMDNAVFGAMRKDQLIFREQDKVLIGAEKLADNPPYGISKAAFTRKLRKEYGI